MATALPRADPISVAGHCGEHFRGGLGGHQARNLLRHQCTAGAAAAENLQSHKVCRPCAGGGGGSCRVLWGGGVTVLPVLRESGERIPCAVGVGGGDPLCSRGGEEFLQGWGAEFLIHMLKGWRGSSSRVDGGARPQEQHLCWPSSHAACDPSPGAQGWGLPPLLEHTDVQQGSCAQQSGVSSCGF